MVSLTFLLTIGVAVFVPFVLGDATTEAQDLTFPPNLTEARVQSLAHDNKGKANACCIILSTFFGQQTFASGDGYQKSLQSYWSQQEQSVAPKCIVVPKSPKDVAATIFILSTASKYITAGCPFAVRGGG